MDQLRITMLTQLVNTKDALHPRGDAERGDVLGWAFIALMTVALAVLIWGATSRRPVEVSNHAMGSPSSI